MISETTESEKRQRIFEILSILCVALVLAGVSRLETRLYELSTSLAQDSSFIPSIIFYGIINLNVLLVIVLSFSCGAKHRQTSYGKATRYFWVEASNQISHDAYGFSLAPTIIIFYVSTRFINESFDEWFGSKVRQTMQEARDASTQIYLQDQRRLEGVARVASSKVQVESLPSFLKSNPIITVPLDGFELEYGVYSVKVFDRNSNVIWSSIRDSTKRTPSIKNGKWLATSWDDLPRGRTREYEYR